MNSLSQALHIVLLLLQHQVDFTKKPKKKNHMRDNICNKPQKLLLTTSEKRLSWVEQIFENYKITNYFAAI